MDEVDDVFAHDRSWSEIPDDAFSDPAPDEDYAEEIHKLEYELGSLVIISGCASYRKGKRIIRTVEGDPLRDERGGIIFTEKVTSIPGKPRKPLGTHGLLALLECRSPRIRKLLNEEPYFFNSSFGVELYGLIESIILIRSEVKHLTTYLSYFPDWTIAVIHEVREIFAKREDYAPDYLMMCFEFSELKTDDELDALVAKFFPGYVGTSTKNRRADLRAKLKQISKRPN